MGDQRRGELQHFAFHLRKTLLDLSAYFDSQISFIRIGDGDQAALIYTLILQTGDDRVDSCLLGPANRHKGNRPSVLRLGQYRQKMQSTTDLGCQIGDPPTLAKIIEIGRDHVRNV